MKKPLKIILIILAVLIGLVAALLIWLTATQLNVKTETAVVTHGENSTASFAPGDSVSILTWNVGYAGLGEESDFFMDGGKGVNPESEEQVRENMSGIEDILRSANADLMLDTTFVDEAALKGYAVHPAHVAVADGKVRPYTAVRTCLDFEV